MEDCIFCKIASGEIPSHKIWEDEKHIAFLGIFPNTEGFTVLIPKKHHSSYFAKTPSKEFCDLMGAAQATAQLLDSKLEDVGRTGLIFEGWGVDHIHAKLIPMHGTAQISDWQAINSNVDKYFKKYEGYISSHDYKREDDEKLAKLAQKIRA
jgi:diadenosine tetraphosphate (Ap4A) HIT family hydrolase